MQRALRAFRNKHLRHAYNAWRDFMELMLRERMLTDRACRRFKNVAMVRAWNSWLDYMVWLATMKRFANSWYLIGLAKSFRSWRSAVNNSARIQQLLRKGLMRFMCFDWASAFGTWRDFAIQMRRERRIISMVISRYRHSREKAFLVAWQEYSENKKIKALEFEMYLTQKHTKSDLPSKSPRSPSRRTGSPSSRRGASLRGSSPRDPVGDASSAQYDQNSADTTQRPSSSSRTRRSRPGSANRAAR